MLYLDLDELPTLQSPWFGYEVARPLSFRRVDYLGDPRRALRDEVWDRVEQTLGPRDRGAVRILTHVRSFGYVFNPVSFYYCFDADDALTAVVAEITNTPWGERHAYVLSAGSEGACSDFEKQFHVSPFFGMQQEYRWRLSSPGDRLTVVMHNAEHAKRVFSAGLSLTRRPFDASHLLRTALRHPAMGMTVHLAIYWQALRLWLKGTPFFAHPNTLEARNHGTIESMAPGKDRTASRVAR
jgi:DUF1365 family protein